MRHLEDVTHKRNAEEAKSEQVSNLKLRKTIIPKHMKKMRKKETDRKRYSNIKVSDNKRRANHKRMMKFR